MRNKLNGTWVMGSDIYETIERGGEPDVAIGDLSSVVYKLPDDVQLDLSPRIIMNGELVLATVRVWAEFMEKLENVLVDCYVDDYGTVTTTFLGVPYGFDSSGRPKLWESAKKSYYEDEVKFYRYTSLDMAKRAHEALVQILLTEKEAFKEKAFQMADEFTPKPMSRRRRASSHDEEKMD